MQKKRVVLSDVAKHAGVSKATVSRYLNHSLKLPEATANKIDTAISELNYKRNAIARHLSKGGGETIGLVVPDITNSFFADLADAAEEVAFQKGYSLVLCITRNNLQKELQFIRWIDTCQVDGLMFITNHPDNGELCNAIRPYSNKIVLIDEDITGCDAAKVFAENRKGGSLATQKLLDAGHTKIAFIGGNRSLMSVQERYAGFSEAMHRAGLNVRDDWIYFGEYEKSFGSYAMEKLLTSQVPPSAIFAASDYLVLGVFDYLRSVNKKVPEDLSIAGFDDASYSNYTQPRISTIKQPAYEMGKIGVEYVIDILQGKFIQETKRLPVHWISRDSVASFKKVHS